MIDDDDLEGLLGLDEDDSEVQSPKGSVIYNGPVSTSFMLGLSVYWWGVAVFWFVMLIVLLPSQIRHLVGDAQKGAALGSICLGAAFFSILFAPLFGYLSDNCTHRWGRRRPFLVVGTVGVVVCLSGMMLVQNVVLFGAFYIAMQTFGNLASCPFNALIPDVVPHEQRGTASGYLGAAYSTGTLTGTVVGYYYDDMGMGWTCALLAFILLASAAVTFHKVEEVAYIPSGSSEAPNCMRELQNFFAPFSEADFRWVFATRLLVQQGVFTVQEFLQYYLKDAVYLPPGLQAESAVSVIMAPLVVMSILSAFVAGHLTDYFNQRKSILYFCGGLMICADILLAFSSSYHGAMLCAFIFGIGYGGFCAIDFCLIMDVLPQADAAGKDLAIWHIALVLPQATAAPIGGLILDAFEDPLDPHASLGYTVLFLTSAMYFAAGIFFLHKVEKVN